MAGLATSQPSRLACSCKRRGEPVIPGVEGDFDQVVGEHVLTSNPSNIVGHSKPLHGQKKVRIFFSSVQYSNRRLRIQIKMVNVKAKIFMASWKRCTSCVISNESNTYASGLMPHFKQSSSENCLCWIKKSKGSRIGWWPQQWITKLMRLKVPWGGSSLSSYVTLLKDVK